MLVLSALPKLLSQVLSPPALHTAVLCSTSGALIAYSAKPVRPKDDVRVLVGLASQVWNEAKNADDSMADSELGRVVVVPVLSASEPDNGSPNDPVLLVVLNSTDAVEWGELQIKARSLATHLSKPLAGVREKLSAPMPSATKVSRR